MVFLYMRYTKQGYELSVVGESENTYSLTWDGTAKESNYRVTATTGKLSVSESKEQITVTTEGGKYVYDGI